MEESEDLFVFHAGVAFDTKGNLLTAGGRVLGITALGVSLEEATARAYSAIDYSWAHYRKDIGKQVYLSSRS